MIYISDGNKKIDKACLVFNLPTTICNGKGKQCKGCYAKKAEYLYPQALPCRVRNLKYSNTDVFIELVQNRINHSRKKLFRIHESGDFYSQAYINKWATIVKNNPKIKFYGYSKKFDKLDLSVLNELENCNIINSLSNDGYNFGDMKYLNKLAREQNFYICPCEIVKNAKCMKNCFACLTENKVCFLKH